MTFSTLGSLVREDLETRAKNFLKLNIANKNYFLHSSELIEEIEFLIDNGYVVKKDRTENLVYEATSKGREYASESYKN